MISFVVLCILMAGYQVRRRHGRARARCSRSTSIGVSVGVGLLLSALNVRYRDVRYAVPFLIQLWLFASPSRIQFRCAALQYRLLFALNPMVAGIEGFRSALLGTAVPDCPCHAISIVVGCRADPLGFVYFRRVERTFADVI